MGLCILFGVSGGPKNHALSQLAFQIAKDIGATISALAIEDTERLKATSTASLGFYSHQAKEIEQRLERANEHVTKRLADLQKLAGEFKVPLEPIRQQGDVLDVGLDAWRFHDLLMMDTQPWAIGVEEPDDSVTILKLIAHGVRPVLAVPKGASPRLSNYLIALSGSLESAKAMKHLLQLNLSPDAAIHIVTAGSPKTGETAEELLEKASSYCKAHGYIVTSAVLDGASSDAILREAERVDADLISIGSSYKKFLLKERFGTHAKTILDKSPVAVFVSH